MLTFYVNSSISVVRNYGSMLVGLCSVIPDGVVAFFTSYSYMESLISEWDAMGILRELTKSKLVFIETKVCRQDGGLCHCISHAQFLLIGRG
jgi:DNA excision repair protein ERCC-2